MFLKTIKSVKLRIFVGGYAMNVMIVMHIKWTHMLQGPNEISLCCGIDLIQV